MEKLALPKKVVNSDWKDDVDYQPYEKEMEYIAPSKVTKESIDKIKARKLNQERGRKFLLFTKTEKLFA